MGIEVGQKVVLVPIDTYRNRKPVEAEITKIGRVYFTVKVYGNEEKFRIDDHTQRYTDCGYGRDWELFLSWDAYNERKEFRVLFSEIRSHFDAGKVYLREHSGNATLTLDKLRRIVAIIDEPVQEGI